MALYGKKKKDAADAAPAEKPVKEKPVKTKKERKAEESKSTEPNVPKPKARPDIYTLLLGLSVVALIIAVVLLFLNINDYGPNPLSGVPR